MQDPVLLLLGPTTPTWQRHWAIPPGWFRLAPVRSPLLGGSRLFFFPPVTEMFQFTEFPQTALCIQAAVTQHYLRRVSPFGHPRVVAY